VSGAGLSSTPAPASSPDQTLPELTDASAQGDATVVRAAPSAPTLSDKSGELDPNSFGKYDLVGEIARGGMGVVYRARQHGLDRLVALKMILGTGTDRDAAQRFLQEARAAAALDHPNVVPIYDIGEINGRPYFTMALVEGPNLRGYAEARGVMPIPEVVTLFAQVVEGVAHAHKHGIIHRDLKPANVLMDRDGRPRVTDFGLAKRAAVDSALTATGQVVGTPQYMAPEQARDSKEVGPPADVYALGAILYFLLTGRPPFVGESFTDLLLKLVTDPPVPPRQLRPDVPEDLDALCLRCLTKQPADRFADAEALAVALLPIIEQYHLSSTSRSSPIARSSTLRTAPTGTVPDLSAVVAGGPIRTAPAQAPPSAPRAQVPARQAPAANPSDFAEGTAPRDRRPLIIGGAALAVVLFALGAYLATRDKKQSESTKNDPPPPPAFELPRPPFPPPPPLPKDADKFAWPAPTRADFGLKVAIAAPAAKKDADGTVLLTAGTLMEVLVTAEKDCRVWVWVLEEGGKEVQLFPNEYEGDNRLSAGQTRVLPGKNRGEFKTTPTEGTADRLRVIATTGDQPPFPKGVPVKQFAVFATPADRERLASTVRGVVLKKPDSADAPSVADVELPFRVRE
jgi:serine/threonine protein kinase